MLVNSYSFLLVPMLLVFPIASGVIVFRFSQHSPIYFLFLFIPLFLFRLNCSRDIVRCVIFHYNISFRYRRSWTDVFSFSF